MSRLSLSTLLIVFLCAAIVLAFGTRYMFLAEPASGSSALSSTVYLWYYLPHDPSQPPEPIEKAKYLGNYNVIYIGPSDEKVLYLTFDDCPNNDNISKILDILKDHNAPGAFFMTEDYIRRCPEVIRRIVDEGSIVCNHTSSHGSVTGLSFDRFREELAGVEDAYREATGQELLRFFRPPEGRFSEVTLSYAEKLGYTTVFWSFRYEDWNDYHQPSPEQALKIVLSETHPGEILLLHSQSSTNIKILDQLMDTWEEQGYSFKPLTDIPVTREADSAN